MKIAEKYLEALKPVDGWMTISEWAIKVGELYPDLLEKANKEAENQANETTGLNEIAARISSNISRGAYASRIDIDASERPRKVRYLTTEQQIEHEQCELEEDVAPLRRSEIIRQAEASFTANDNYRVAEFEAIAKQLKEYFGLSFEVDHAQALLNKGAPGSHHPDNLQLLLKAHNGTKNNKNWKRFSLEEQVSYINAAIAFQALISERLGIDMVDTVLEALYSRLERVY